MKPLSECHVVVTPTLYGRYNPKLGRELEEKVGRVTYNETGRPLLSQELAELLPIVDGYIAGLDEINAHALAHILKIIARYEVGVNNVDLDSARANGIVVTNTPGSNSKSVAELTKGLILNSQRLIWGATTQTKNGE
ncbi:MAG: hypothetical protein AAGD96_12940 [Chloroflexota bacterium]